MKIGFDQAKNDKNIQGRGLSFADAARIFLGNTLEWDDTRLWYGGERRIHAVGMAEGFCLSVVYTWRWDAVEGAYRWIISARVASRKERRKHAAHFNQ